MVFRQHLWVFFLLRACAHLLLPGPVLNVPISHFTFCSSHFTRHTSHLALSYLTLINWAIVRKVPFLGYSWDPSWGPEDIILDTVAILGWYSWGHWIQQPCFRSLSYPKLQFWAKGTKVVGLPTCVAQLLPIWPWAFSLTTRLKATGVTDLGSKGTYGIGGLSWKKYVKFSQKACS